MPIQCTNEDIAAIVNLGNLNEKKKYDHNFYSSFNYIAIDDINNMSKNHSIIPPLNITSINSEYVTCQEKKTLDNVAKFVM